MLKLPNQKQSKDYMTYSIGEDETPALKYILKSNLYVKFIKK